MAAPPPSAPDDNDNGNGPLHGSGRHRGAYQQPRRDSEAEGLAAEIKYLRSYTDTKIGTLRDDAERSRADVRERIERVQAQIDGVHKRFDDYVTKERNRPVELITYGLAGAVLMTVLGLFLAQLVLR